MFPGQGIRQPWYAHDPPAQLQSSIGDPMPSFSKRTSGWSPIVSSGTACTSSVGAGVGGAGGSLRTRTLVSVVRWWAGTNVRPACVPPEASRVGALGVRLATGCLFSVGCAAGSFCCAETCDVDLPCFTALLCWVVWACAFGVVQQLNAKATSAQLKNGFPYLRGVNSISTSFVAVGGSVTRPLQCWQAESETHPTLTQPRYRKLRHRNFRQSQENPKTFARFAIRSQSALFALFLLFNAI